MKLGEKKTILKLFIFKNISRYKSNVRSNISLIIIGFYCYFIMG